MSKEIDKLLSEYSSYPESEWGEHEVFPPDDFETMAAWEGHRRDVFVFLLRIQEKLTCAKYYLYVAGKDRSFDKAKALLLTLKHKFELHESNSRKIIQTRNQLDRIRPQKSLAMLVALSTGCFAIINRIFSYLQSLPAPYKKVETLYQVLMGTIYLISLFALNVILLVFAVYVVIYGWVFVKHHFVAVKGGEI